VHGLLLDQSLSNNH